MRFGKFVLAAALVLAGTGMANAATVKGRITAMDEKAHQITLDNSDIYSVGPKVDLSTLSVGSAVQLDVSGKAGQQTVTAAKKTG